MSRISRVMGKSALVVQPTNNDPDIKNKKISTKTRENRFSHVMGKNTTYESHKPESRDDTTEDTSLLITDDLQKELIRKTTADSFVESLKTPPQYMLHGYLHTDIKNITDPRVLKVIEDLGSPDYVYLKEGIHTEIIIPSIGVPIKESVTNRTTYDWRQVYINNVPNLYIKF